MSNEHRPAGLWAVLKDLRLIDRLSHKGDHEKALRIADGLHVYMVAAEIRSPFVSWQLAVCFGKAGHLDRALNHIMRSLRLDPYGLRAQHSLDVITVRAKEAVTAPDWDSRTPRIYKALCAAGLADLDCQVAWARHLFNDGQVEEALRESGAILVLHPESREALEIQAAARQALGIPEEAAAPEQRLTTLTDPADDVEGGSNWLVA